MRINAQEERFTGWHSLIGVTPAPSWKIRRSITISGDEDSEYRSYAWRAAILSIPRGFMRGLYVCTSILALVLLAVAVLGMTLSQCRPSMFLTDNRYLAIGSPIARTCSPIGSNHR